MHTEAPNGPALRAAQQATLNCRAVTAEARALIDTVTARITTDEFEHGRKNARRATAVVFRKAVEGFVGDLMLAQGRHASQGWIKQSRKAKDFSDAPVSYRNFKRLVDSLERTKLIEIKGPVAYNVVKFDPKRPLFSQWQISRFRASPELLALAERYGIADPSRHFCHCTVRAADAEGQIVRLGRKGREKTGAADQVA